MVLLWFLYIFVERFCKFAELPAAGTAPRNLAEEQRQQRLLQDWDRLEGLVERLVAPCINCFWDEFRPTHARS